MADWSQIRQQLGGEFSYGCGHWFCVPHSEVRRRDGSLFSEKKGGDGRRVVIADRHGPNATLYPRSRLRRRGFEHPAHSHVAGPGRCKLDESGRVVFPVPVNVPLEVLNDETYSCVEPDGSPLWEALERRASS